MPARGRRALQGAERGVFSAEGVCASGLGRPRSVRTTGSPVQGPARPLSRALWSSNLVCEQEPGVMDLLEGTSLWPERGTGRRAGGGASL